MAEGFNWVEGTSTVEKIVKAVATDLTLGTSNVWKLKYPNTTDSIVNMAILETKTSFEKTFYLKIERKEEDLNRMYLTIGVSLNSNGDDLDDIQNEPARFSWYKVSKEVQLFEWVPIQYWMSYSEDFINIVIQGDPSLDIEPYDRYLISYGYVGALESFEGADSDTDYNFGITVSSDMFFKDGEYPEQYGQRTASCITDIGMVGTRTGTPFQAHLPKFSTNWEFADRNFINSSQWTHKYHMSDIVVYHAYDRERGKLQNVLIGDRSAIYHLDILLVDKGKPEEKQYVMFNINAPYSILNNGANVLFGVALRKA